MSIPIRKDGELYCEVDIVGFDIPCKGRIFLVVERIDNQVQYRFEMLIDSCLCEPPLPSDSEPI